MRWNAITTSWWSPLRWLTAAEDGLLWLASEAEYRLKITPRSVRLRPSMFIRRFARLSVLILGVLLASLAMTDPQQRVRLILLVVVVAVVASVGIVVADANSAGRVPPPKASRKP